MIGLVLFGLFFFGLGAVALIFRDYFSDARAKWYDELWPFRWKPPRWSFLIDQLYTGAVAIAVGALLLVIGLTQ